MNKRRILALAIVVCLIAILACGSLAYFTYTKTVTNTFYTYSTKDFPIEDYPNGPSADQLFSISVYETGVNGEKDYDGLTYENVLPGSELAKDPTVENTGKYPAWVRLNVTVTNATAWKNACADIGLTGPDKIFLNFNNSEATDKATGWYCANPNNPTFNQTADQLTYVYYSNNPLKPGEASKLFNGIKMPDKLTVEHMIALSQFQIIITGDAIQSDNTGATAAEAFTNCWVD